MDVKVILVGGWNHKSPEEHSSANEKQNCKEREFPIPKCMRKKVSTIRVHTNNKPWSHTH